jgi:hypothetical protein
LNINVAVEFLDIRFHHVHADPPAGHVRDVIFGRKARQEDQLETRHFIKRIRGLDIDETFGQGLLTQDIGTHASAVVADLEHDVVTSLLGTESNRGAHGLASSGTVDWHLDAVVDGIADQVDEGILQVFDDGLVELGFVAADLEFDFLAELASKVAHQSGIFLEQAPHRLHAGLHHRALQIAHQQIKLGDRSVHGVDGIAAGIAGQQFGAQAVQAVLG